MRVLPVVVFALALQGVRAEPPSRPHPPPPPRMPDAAKDLGLAPPKAAQVDAILAEEREQHRAARERAAASLRKVLSAEEMARFEALRPRPPARPRGPMHGDPDRGG